MVKLLKFIKGKAIIFAIIAPLMMFLEVIMDLKQPVLMADIIDIGVANGDLNYVLIIGIKMMFYAFIGFLGGIGCSFFSSVAAMSMGQELRQELFNKIQTLSFIEIDKFKTSSLITKLTNDVTQVQQMLHMSLKIMVRAPLMCIGGLIMAFTLSKELSMIFLVTVPIIIGSISILMSKAFPLFKGMQEKIDGVNNVMRENLLGIRVVKAFTMENKQKERFLDANSELMNKSIEAQRVTIILWPVVTLVMNLGIVAVLWFGGNMANNGAIEVGKIMAFINYLVQIMGSLTMAVMIMINISRAKASAERINEVFSVDPSIKNVDNTKETDKFDVEFKNVSFRYNHKGEYVLKDISFKANEGETIGIIGVTGSGKSSFIGLIPRLYDAVKGEVLIGGVDVKELDIKNIRNNIGVVLQDNILFSGTIEDNLRFGNENASEMLLESASMDAEAYEFISKMPNKFESLVEQRGKNLSGGQKQRLSIARTLVKEPKILIMDDSTSAVDMATEGKIQKAIKDKMGESTVFIIAQRISGVMDADKIIVIDNGEINGIGNHKELLESNEIYRNIAISQLGEEVLLNGK